MAKKRLVNGLVSAFDGLGEVFEAVDRDVDRVKVMDAVNALKRLEAQLLKRQYSPVLNVEPRGAWGMKYANLK